VDECKPLAGGASGEDHSGAVRVPGEAVQVDPIKPVLKPPETKRLILKYDEPLSNFAFKFNLRHYNLVRKWGIEACGYYHEAGAYTRPLLSST
jgi:hypothetical protein